MNKTTLLSLRLLKLTPHINGRQTVNSRHKEDTGPAALRLFFLWTPSMTPTLQAAACRFVSERKRAWPVHFSNWLTDGKSLRFGLVSDQAAINQRAVEREACGEGRRWEDKRSEWTDRINSWPRGSASRLARGVMKRCHLHLSRPANWSVLMKVPPDGGTPCLQSYIMGPWRPAAKSLRGKMSLRKGQSHH